MFGYVVVNRDPIKPNYYPISVCVFTQVGRICDVYFSIWTIIYPRISGVGSNFASHGAVNADFRKQSKLVPNGYVSWL